MKNDDALAELARQARASAEDPGLQRRYEAALARAGRLEQATNHMRERLLCPQLWPRMRGAGDDRLCGDCGEKVLWCQDQQSVATQSARGERLAMSPDLMDRSLRGWLTRDHRAPEPRCLVQAMRFGAVDFAAGPLTSPAGVEVWRLVLGGSLTDAVPQDGLEAAQAAVAAGGERVRLVDLRDLSVMNENGAPLLAALTAGAPPDRLFFDMDPRSPVTRSLDFLWRLFGFVEPLGAMNIYHGEGEVLAAIDRQTREGARP